MKLSAVFNKQQVDYRVHVLGPKKSVLVYSDLTGIHTEEIGLWWLKNKNRLIIEKEQMGLGIWCLKGGLLKKSFFLKPYLINKICLNRKWFITEPKLILRKVWYFIAFIHILHY